MTVYLDQLLEQAKRKVKGKDIEVHVGIDGQFFYVDVRATDLVGDHHGAQTRIHLMEVATYSNPFQAQKELLDKVIEHLNRTKLDAQVTQH